MMRCFTVAVALVVLLFTLVLPASAGPVFLTGHDPDFHAQPGLGNGQTLLTVGLDFATGATTFSAANKFLWVEAFPADIGGVPSGHVFGKNALLSPLGLTEGTHFDHVNAAGFAAANLSNYTAIAVASSFGGILSRAELDALIARKEDIKNFVNAGGGIFASSEADNAGADLLGVNPDPFGWLPINVVSIGANPPFFVTPFGAGLGLTNGDVNDPTHNSFPDAAGLNIVDTDQSGNPTTLAGDVFIGDTGFTTVIPEPTSLAIWGLVGLGGAAYGWRRKRRKGAETSESA